MFYGLLNKQKALKSQYNFLQKESKGQLDACKKALDKESAEVTKLKTALEKANTRVEELTGALGIERTAREKEAKEHEEKLAELASRGTTAEQELKKLQDKCDAWLAELVVITDEMGRKCLSFFRSFPGFYFSVLSLPRPITLLAAVFLISEFYETSATKAFREAQKARAQRAATEPVSEKWEIPDHLTAIRSRLEPLNLLGSDVLRAGVKMYRLLWPDAPLVRRISDLAYVLGGAEERFRAWRSSSARAGADQALQFVLSWYETIELEKVQFQREGSEWLSNPERIAKRLSAADHMANYAETSVLDDGRIYSDAEEEEEAPPREEAGSSDSAATDDGSDGDSDAEEEEVVAPDAAAPKASDAAVDTVMTEAANASAKTTNASAAAASDATTTSASAGLAVDPQTSNPAT